MRFSIRTESGRPPKNKKVEKVAVVHVQELTDEEFDRWAGVRTIRMMSRGTPAMVREAREAANRRWYEVGENHRVEGGKRKRDFPTHDTYFIDIETLDDLKALRAEEGHPIRLEDDEIIVLDEDYY